MTLNELKNDVAALGFESYVEDEERFIASANRALDLLYVDRPVSKNAQLSFHSPRVSMTIESIEHHSGEIIDIPIHSGKAISFYQEGEGECVITDNTGSSLIIFPGAKQLVRKRLNGAKSISFRGDYYYTVSNLAVFEDIKNSNIADIPEYSAMREITITDVISDFRAFAGLPTDKHQNVINEAKLEDKRISLPYEFSGEVYLTYYRTPKKISADQPNSEIDVSPECAPLLPLLTASFTWLDDDAAKAQYYMSLYRDAIANIKRFSNIRIDTKYRSNGWA